MPKLEDVSQEIIAGRYRVERLLGRGATANVYLAHDGSFGRAVAVKVLLPDVAHAVGVELFLREIRLTARMQHPHIVAIHDSGVWNDLPFFVMPYMEGGSLRERLKREPQLPLREVARITSEVADALSYAHQYGLVHRDIKPENILFTGDHALVADFGIARVTSAAIGVTETTTGLIRGTPAYMSPEQASGDVTLDGRSDLYSLACVVYEMIAGVPPFVGPTDRIVMAQRLSHAAPPLKVYRSSVPAAMEKAVASAMTTSAADRERDPRVFANRLASSLETLLPAPRSRARWGVAALAVVLVLGAIVSPWRGVESVLHRRQLDSLRIAVVQIPDQTSNDSATNPGAAISALSTALSEWSDINVTQLEPAAKRDSPRQALAHSVREAADAGSRWLVTLQLHAGGDSNRVLASLVDAETGQLVRRVDRAVAHDANTIAAYSDIAGLLFADDLNGDPEPSVRHGSSMQSWRAYSRGSAQLRRWRLDSAEQSFKTSVQHDHAFTLPAVWLSQLLIWKKQSPSGELLAALARGLERQAELAPRDSLIARAIVAMTARNYSGACAAYNRLREHDSLDVVAWLGLGDCHARDRVIVRDSRSPSGWRFRSSYQAAINAYLHAAEIAPASNVVFQGPNAPGVLLLQTNHMVLGVALPPDTGRFAASPYMDVRGDTVLLIPYRYAAVLSGEAPPVSLRTGSGVNRLIDRHRALLVALARARAQASPNDPDAQEAFSRALELYGDIAQSRVAAIAALASATDDRQRFRLAASRVRLEIKSGAFAEARIAAESLLSAAPRTGNQDSLQTGALAALAALVGHADEVGKWLALSAATTDGESDLPVVVRQPVARFVAVAALERCDLFGRAEADVDSALRRYLPPARYEAARMAIMPRIFSLGASCDGARRMLTVKDPPDGLMRMQQAFARGQFGAVRAQLDTLEHSRQSDTPGDVSLDYTVREAWLEVQIGDTAKALARLRLTLEALPTLGIDQLTQVPQTAAICEILDLATQLASARHEAGSATKWQKNRSELCGNRS